MNELERKLLEANVGTYTRFWGVIDTDNGTFVIKGTCRRCGRHGEFTTQQGADAFKSEHQGQNNRCPYENEVIW